MCRDAQEFFSVSLIHSFLTSGINLESTYDELVASDCTTCKVSADKSAYWIPGLYYQFPNGSFQSVDHGGMLVYADINAPVV